MNSYRQLDLGALYVDECGQLVDPNELVEMFEEGLEYCYPVPEICGLTLTASEILKTMEWALYDAAFDEYALDNYYRIDEELNDAERETLATLLADDFNDGIEVSFRRISERIETAKALV